MDFRKEIKVLLEKIAGIEDNIRETSNQDNIKKLNRLKSELKKMVSTRPQSGGTIGGNWQTRYRDLKQEIAELEKPKQDPEELIWSMWNGDRSISAEGFELVSKVKKLRKLVKIGICDLNALRQILPNVEMKEVK